MRPAGLALLIGALLTASPSIRAAELRDHSAERAGLQSVIVYLRGRAPVSELPAGRSARGRLVATLRSRWQSASAAPRRLLEAEGARAESLWAVHAIAVRASPATIARLAALPEVERVQPDAAIELPGAQRAPPGPAAWNLAAIGAPQVWARGLAGAGATVAVLDSGADFNHPDLEPKWRRGPGGWFDPYGQHAAPRDVLGHGTQVLGLIVGGSVQAPLGVAPEATWIAARIYDDSGRSTVSAVHRALQWALDPDGDPATDDAPDVVNASWGDVGRTGQCVEEFRYDLQLLRAAGIAVAIAAGNQGPGAGTSVSPANYPESLSVGVVDSSLLVPDFSSRGPSACWAGPYPALAAPGDAVLTTDLTYGGALPESYAEVSGTSFAAAHVAGALALLLKGGAGRTASAVERALQTTAADLGSPGLDWASGHGLIDLEAAEEELTRTRCTDEDGDGYPREPECSDQPDCDDARGDVHPSAEERARDAIDQDCDGLDLTIQILSAAYSDAPGLLTVWATSQRDASAGLTVEGFGPMSWVSGRGRWELTAVASERPVRVVVRGAEGAAQAPVSLTTPVSRFRLAPAWR